MLADSTHDSLARIWWIDIGLRQAATQVHSFPTRAGGSQMGTFASTHKSNPRKNAFSVICQGNWITTAVHCTASNQKYPIRCDHRKHRGSCLAAESAGYAAALILCFSFL